MLRFLLQRLLALIPVLFTVAVIVFLILRLTPGDPAAVIAGNNAANAAAANNRWIDRFMLPPEDGFHQVRRPSGRRPTMPG